MRVSVLDLGSNSFHALVADVTRDGLVEPYLRQRSMLHLGAVVARHGHLPRDVADLAVGTVRHLDELTRRTGAVERRAVATSALRDAANGPEVLARMAEVLGSPVDLLEGPEESELAFEGAHAVLALDGQRWLVLDLGGGSLEVAAGGPDGVSYRASVDVGVSRLGATVTDLDRPMSAHEVHVLSERVRDALAPHALAGRDVEEVVAAGGTVRALGKVVAARHLSWLPLDVNQLSVGRDELLSVRDELCGMTTSQREGVPGMKDRRADRLHVAAVILHAALETLGAERFTVSAGGVREGVLLRLAGVSAPSDRTTMRWAAVQYVHENWTPDDAHGSHVVRLAARLFDELRDLHGLGDADRELLSHAAKLHDIGQAVALKGHHRHGAYLVENASLPGFAPVEIAQLATLTRFHRVGPPDEGYEPWDALPGEARERTLSLLGLLQLADGLDRARDQHVTDVDIRVEDGALHVDLTGEHLQLHRDDVLAKGALLADRLGLRLVLDTDLAAGAA